MLLRQRIMVRGVTRHEQTSCGPLKTPAVQVLFATAATDCRTGRDSFLRYSCDEENSFRAVSINHAIQEARHVVSPNSEPLPSSRG